MQHGNQLIDIGVRIVERGRDADSVAGEGNHDRRGHQSFPHGVLDHREEHGALAEGAIFVDVEGDADRLDLPRVGILTESYLLNTQEARRIADSQDYTLMENANFEFNRETETA